MYVPLNNVAAGEERWKGCGKDHVNFSWSKQCYECTEIEGVSIVFVYPACLICFIVPMGLASTPWQLSLGYFTSRSAEHQDPPQSPEIEYISLEIISLHGSSFASHLFSSVSSAVLTLYFLYFLHWNEDTSTSVYHAFSSLCYFTPILGAAIADSWLGKFK